MKYLKLFEDIAKDRNDFLEQLCDQMPGDCSMMGIMSTNTPEPALVFVPADASSWENFTVEADAKEHILNLREKYDDVVFGETEEELQRAINDTTCSTVDLKKAERFLSSPLKISRSNGMPIQQIIVFEHATGSVEIWCILKTDKKLAQKYRGHISGRKFGI